MESGVKTTLLRIAGMTCVNCKYKIEKKLRGTAGIRNARVNYGDGTAEITYDKDIISLREMSSVIDNLGYRASAANEKRATEAARVFGVIFAVAALYALLQTSGILNTLVPGRLADTQMGYGMLFVIGLITSVHCVAMCSGINLSQCIPRGDEASGDKGRFRAFIPAFLYNFGRVAAYTATGFILGFIGLLFGGGSTAGLPSVAQGILKLIAGAFMVVMGINMLGIFPWLRKLRPGIPKAVSSMNVKNKSPLVVGLLNGLMPCGPLQSMQIVALASGSPLAGGLSMLLFSLGTVPLMFGLGSAVSALGQKFAQRTAAVGAVLVAALGLAMLSQGGSLSGFMPPDLLPLGVLALCVAGAMGSLPFRKAPHKTAARIAALCVMVLALGAWGSVNMDGNAAAKNESAESAIEDIGLEDGKQIVNSTLSSRKYPNITVKAGIPVKWIIDAPKGSVNGCNNRIIIPNYDIEYSFKTGENVIEFTPDKAGTIMYSCWMGMIRGTITVTEGSAASFIEPFAITV